MVRGVGCGLRARNVEGHKPDLQYPHRLVLQNRPRQVQRLYSDLPFREPNINADGNLPHNFCEAEESAPLLSRATNLKGRVYIGVETNIVRAVLMRALQREMI